MKMNMIERLSNFKLKTQTKLNSSFFAVLHFTVTVKGLQ